MKKSLALSAAVLAGVASFSLAQNQQGNPAQPGQNTTAPPAQPDAPQRQGQAQIQPLQQQEEQEYLKSAASDNQFEIQAGQFVEQKAKDPQVKQLAQRLVQDHQKAQQQLQQVAQQTHMTVSDQLDPVCQAKLQALQQKQGQQLETCFVFEQVGAHEMDVLMNQFVAEHAQDPQIKQYAQQQVPILEQHLKLARQCAEQFVPQARTAGEHLRGQLREGANKLESGARDLTGSGNQPENTGAGGAGTQK